MAASVRHPELKAIEQVFDILRALPDARARERVMTYVHGMIGSEADAPPEPSHGFLRANGEAIESEEPTLT